MNSAMKCLLLVAFTLITSTSLFARWATQDEVTHVATVTLKKPFFQKIFPNATIESVVDLEGLWCVNLAPKGHLIFSGSTKQMPLLMYATNAYLTPTKENPDFTIQAGMRARAKDLEKQTAITFAVSPTSAEIAWNALLNPQPKVQPFAVTEEEEEEEEVLPDEVDLTSDEWNPNWSQWEPWNDFCPQFAAESDTTSNYRNRAPVGCAATMYTQIMKYYAWPQRIDAIYTKTLSFPTSVIRDQNGSPTDYAMRFHGGLPIEWNTLYDVYWTDEDDQWSPTYTSEAVRFPVARLGLLIDILSEMNFDSNENGGSGTSLLKVIDNDWYDCGLPDEKEADNPFTEEQLTQIKEVLANGMPIPASIPGHAIFICGYQVNDSGTYLKLNYGWNNVENDDGTDSNRLYLAEESQLEAWVLTHSPKIQVQVAPLPKVINANALPSVMWMVPEFHEDEFKNFTVSATPYSSDTLMSYEDSMIPFTDLTVDKDSFEIVVLQDAMENEVDALVIKSSTYELETYTFPEAFIPTENTTLSFVITNLYEEDATFDTAVNIQLWNETEMMWKTLDTFPKKSDTDQFILPDTITLSLADYAERFCKLRLRLSSINDDDNETEEEGEEEEEESNAKSCYALTDIALTHIYQQGKPQTTQIKNAGTREHQLANLTTEFGSRYRIKVNATTAENDPVHSGETFTRLTNEAVATPSIESVTTKDGKNLIDDVLLKGDLYGTSTFRVSCNDDVTKMRVWPSCTTLITDDDITIEKQDNAPVFDITIQSPEFDPSELDALDGSRMILTLEARTAQGNVVYRDITLALRTVIEWSVDEETLEIPRAWFREYNLADADTSVDELTVEELKALAEEDYDEDGLLNWQEYLCGTSPIDEADKLQIKNLIFNDDGTLQEVIYTPTAAEQGAIQLEGKATLTDATWETANLATHRFFRLRVTTK